MSAKPAPRAGWESFARPAGVSQRRYEAVRAYLLEGAALAEAAARFGYSPSALASLVRDFRAGKLALFAEPGKPGRKSAPKKHAARGRVVGLLLAGPDLVALDLPALARKAGYPGTKVIPAVSWLLSLLALKLTATRRVSHVDDPASALFAGLAILPKKSALTSYS